MIYARVAGTAMHLAIGENNQITYKKYRIWGIKTLIRYLVEDIFNIFIDNLPENEETLEPEQDLIVPLKELSERYMVPLPLVKRYIEERKAPKQIWETLDADQQVMFIINAFFEAFEENLVESYYVAINFSKLITLNPKLKITLKRLDFSLGNFSFVFRARGYSHIFSKNICNNGFNNTVKRLNDLLLKEYIDTFIDKREASIETQEAKMSFNLSDLSEEKRYVIEMLREGNEKEKLEAIDLIIQNHIYEAIEELEYLLSDKSEAIMNAAYEAVIILKGLDSNEKESIE